MTQRSKNNPSSQLNADERVLLVGDVGGTNARFSVFVAGSAARAERARGAVNLATGDFDDVESLVREARSQLGADLPPPSAATIAVAGPVQNGVGRLTNGVLEFDEAQLNSWLGCPVRLVNDFYAVAASIDDLTPVLSVGAPLPALRDVRAVLGPGTGLGMGYLLPPADASAKNWQVFASEGGNADFAPVDGLELELLAILQRSFAPVSIETLVSGRGLPHLYAALCELWGARPEHTSAAAISDAALAFAASDEVSAGLPAAEAVAGDPLSHKTLELFCAMLGTAAGNFALNIGARGGVYLAGGILPRLQDFFLTSDFRRRFEDRGPLADFNRQIPTLLVRDPAPGLTGALALAQRLLP